MEKVPDWARNTADFCIEKYSITGRRASNLGPAYKQIVYILFAGKHNHSQFAEKTKLLPETGRSFISPDFSRKLLLGRSADGAGAGASAAADAIIGNLECHG